MRLIEKEMLNAIANHQTWAKDNTAVYTFNNGTWQVFLHGNHIASGYGDEVDVITETLKQWATPTTKSRLRALGVDVCTKRGVVYLNGEAI